MKRAYLHIGVEKTGSTTIQAFMARNRPALRQKGFLYPSAPGRENHVGLTILVSDNPNQLSGLLPFVGLAAGADLKAYTRKMVLDFADEATKSACDTVVLSNEHLSSRIRNAKSITMLRETLLGMADAVEVIVYLRRQDEAVLSEYSTRVKAGYTEPFALQPHQLRNFNYAELLDRWSSVFGSQHIAVRLFESESFEGGDLVSDFLHVIRYTGSAPLNHVPPQNVSLDVMCLEYLRRLNKFLPAFIDGRPNRERGNIFTELTAISTGEKPRISTEEADEILRHFEKSNCDVAVRYLKRKDGRLFATSPQRSVKNNLLVVDEDMAYKVSAALWRRRRGFR